MNEKSCVGCKFLYTQCEGYSNYTVEDIVVHCAKDRNPNLGAPEPYDWIKKADNWPRTNSSRCDLYAPGPLVALDVEGEDGPADYTDDEEAIVAICAHADRGRHGDYTEAK